MAKRTVHIPDALDAQSEDAAWTLRLSFSALVTRALNSYLNAYTQVGPGASLAPQGQGEIDSCSTTPTPQRIPRRRNS